MLGIAGAVLLLVGGFALYARQELFNSDAFSQTAAKSLQDEAVRDALAEPIVEQIINIGPDQLINAQPLLQGGGQRAPSRRTRSSRSSGTPSARPTRRCSARTATSWC